MAKQDPLKLIEQEDNLPVLPELFYQVVEASSNPETPVSEVSHLILQDQVLTGRVLRIANSAYYAMPERISTVTRAVMVLGFISLRNFLTAITVVDTLNSDAFKGGLFETFWIHALACSVSASSLADRLKMNHREEAMIAGLVHDCGKLFLDHHFPEAYRAVIEKMRQGKDVLAAERDVFGLTHVEVGEKIAQRWALPPSIVEAIRNHHHFSKSPKNLSLADIIYVADRFAIETIPHDWADRIQWIPSGNNTKEPIKKICLEVGLSPHAFQEIIEEARENIERTAEDLNLKFLNPSVEPILDPSPELFRLHREIERKERQLAMVNEISTFIMENPRPEDLIQVVAEAIHRGIGFNRTLLFLLNSARNTIRGRLGLGHDVPPFLRTIHVPVGSEGLMGKTIREKRALNVLDAESRSDNDLPPLEVPALHQIKAFALVPFIAGTEVIGLVMVDNAVTREVIRDQEVDLIKSFLTLAGVYLAGYSKTSH
jgi:putative nucleotidyltransferase with HDIG domain